MCAHYESVSDKARLEAHFGIDLPSELARRDVWPGYLSAFTTAHAAGATPARRFEKSKTCLICWPCSKKSPICNNFNQRQLKPSPGYRPNSKPLGAEPARLAA